MTSPGPFACHDARGFQYAKVLADQRLRHSEGIDELVNAARRLAKLQHERNPYRRGERAEEVACGVENLAPRRFGQRGGAVLMVLDGLRCQSGNGFHYVCHDTCAIAHVNAPRCAMRGDGRSRGSSQRMCSPRSGPDGRRLVEHLG